MPREHDLERGAHRDLGLAEADVAADQAVHRAAAREVGEHLVDRALLVGRLLEREARLELAQADRRAAERAPLLQLARRVDLEQLARHREDRLVRLRLDALPRRAAELVEPRARRLRADVVLDEVDAVDREIEPVAARVLEVEIVAFRVRDVQVAQAAVEPDAVIDVDDVVVGLELGDRARRRPTPTRRPRRTRRSPKISSSETTVRRSAASRNPAETSPMTMPSRRVRSTSSKRATSGTSIP